MTTDNRGPDLRRGVFLAIEGIDGAGKTSQALDLKAWLEGRGVGVRYVKEPTDGAWGQKIRRIAAEGRSGVLPEDELEYFIRDREEDVRDNILPALARGDVVIADRYYYSTMAYQSVLGLPLDRIRERNAGFPVPDRVFLLVIPPDLSRHRITGLRGEQANLGYEQLDFLTRVAKVFDALPDPNILRVNGEAPFADVADILRREAWGLVEGVRV